MPDDADKTTVQTSSTDADANPVQPAQDPGAPVAPVPAPGHVDSSAGPGVRTAQAADRDEVEDGGDVAADSPGAWTALAAPGKPDGEVDTRR